MRKFESGGHQSFRRFLRKFGTICGAKITTVRKSVLGIGINDDGMHGHLVIIHLYSGRDSKAWTTENWNGYEILNVDIALGTQFDMHSVGTWRSLCHLAKNGHVVAVVGGPPCRSVSRLRHREPGPRDGRRLGLGGLSTTET